MQELSEICDAIFSYVFNLPSVENPIIFDFNISGVDENSVGMTVSKMKSIYKIVSIEETTPTKTGEIYKSDEKM